MAIGFKYWDDCVDPQDIEAMWSYPQVCAEWLDAGESKTQKVHLSRDPDGQPYLTQTEMKAVADIIVHRHFDSNVDSEMICAIAELQSDRQPLATRYDKKTKETTLGIMQITLKTAEWLVSELGYQSYQLEGNPEVLSKPFASVYFGAAYLKWLSNFEQKERSEEFVVRAYKGGTKKATHKTTLPYWKRYLSVKESLPSRKHSNEVSSSATSPPPASGNTEGAATNYTFWDCRATPEDMEEMWNNPNVLKEWTKSGEKKGNVRFSHDLKKRPYVSRVELKAIAEIILSKHFSTKGVKPTVLCALAEVVSMRFINGVGARPGIMGIDYSTAFWLYMELSYRAYRLDSVDDLTKPFVSMYFGAAYLAWLSDYEGRERTRQFVVQAYIAGPQNVDLQETGPLWLKFEEALSNSVALKGAVPSCKAGIYLTICFHPQVVNHHLISHDKKRMEARCSFFHTTKPTTTWKFLFCTVLEHYLFHKFLLFICRPIYFSASNSCLWVFCTDEIEFPSFLIMQYIFLPFHCLLFLRMFSSLFKLVAPAFFTA